jgi:hypothetical protein
LPKKTFEAAAVADAHLIVQLKENQPILCQKVEAVCAAAEPQSSARTVDQKRRNRHETRAVTVFAAAPAVAGTEWEPLVAAIIKVERAINVRQAATGLWKLSSETSFCPAGQSAQMSPRTPSASTGGSKTNPTTPAMSLSARTPRAFEPTPESSPDSGASLTISCVATNPTQSLKTASPPLSQALNQYSP